SVVLIRIVELIQVELNGGKAHVFYPLRMRGKILRGRKVVLIKGSIAIDPDPVAEFATQQLINRNVQRLAGKIPKGGFNGRQHGDEHAGLRAFKEATPPDVFKQPVHVQRTASPDPPTHHLNEMVCSRRRIHGFATTPNILVGVYLDEKTVPVPDIAALDLRDLQITGRRQLRCTINGFLITFSEGGEG